MNGPLILRLVREQRVRLPLEVLLIAIWGFLLVAVFATSEVFTKQLEAQAEQFGGLLDLVGLDPLAQWASIGFQHPIFLLGWILMHEIDETSPLFGATAESLAAGDAMLLLTIEGSDETAAQTLQARHSWQHDEIRWGYRFVDLMHDEGSVTHVDYGNFHEIVPVDEPAGQA